MIFRPYPYPPMPWWMLVTMIPPETILKAGKKAYGLVQDTREKAKGAGRKHRTAWDERMRQP